MIEAIRAGDLDQVCRLLDAGILPDMTDTRDVPALVIAASAGHADIVEVLLAAGAIWDNALVQNSLTVPSDEGGRSPGSLMIAQILRRYKPC